MPYGKYMFSLKELLTIFYTLFCVCTCVCACAFVGQRSTPYVFILLSTLFLGQDLSVNLQFTFLVRLIGHLTPGSTRPHCLALVLQAGTAIHLSFRAKLRFSYLKQSLYPLRHLPRFSLLLHWSLFSQEVEK